MTIIYQDDDADIRYLQQRHIALVGYGEFGAFICSESKR